MNRYPVQVWGPSYHDRSLPFSAQSTVNLWPSRPSQDARSIRALHPWPGARLFSAATTTNDSDDRGMGVLNGTLYKLSGATLESVNAGGDRTTIGTIPAGQGRCDFSTDGTNLIISTGAARYQYNGTTLSTITDASHEPGNTSTFLNRQMIYDGYSGSFWVADVDDPDNINALNFATAESRPDDSVAVYAFRNNMVYIFGTESLEGWYNDASASNPAYTRVDGSIHPVGLSSPYVLADDRRAVYFLGDDRNIYRLLDQDLTPITPIAMESFLESENLEDAFAFTIQYSNQYFYIITFPKANKTWGIPVLEPTNAFQLSSDLVRGRHLAGSYQYLYGKHLIGDYRSGDIYEWADNVYTDKGKPKLFERALGPINAEALGQTGAEITMNRFEFVMETGVGNTDVTNPQALLDVSFDGGNSWTNEQWVSMGEDGQQVVVRLDVVRTAKDIIPRIRVSDPAKLSLHSSAIHANIVKNAL